MTSYSMVGLLIKQRRIEKGWSRAKLAELYGRALREAPVSVEAIRLMEEQNRVPKQRKRRVILASLLDLPLALFGVTYPEDIEGVIHAVSPAKERFHMEVYQVRLRDYWDQHYTDTAQTLVDEVLRSISVLQEEIPYATDRTPLLEMLCGYHLLLGNMLRDRGELTTAMREVNKASRLATTLEDPVLQAVTYYRRGWLCCDQGRYQQAAQDFEIGSALVIGHQPSASQLAGALQLGVGHARLHCAASGSEILSAIRMMDHATRGISQGEDRYFLRFNAQRYHLDRAAALLGVPAHYRAPASALEQLDLAQQKRTPGYTRRGVYALILEAQAHLQQNYFPTATVLATEALNQAYKIQSQANVARVASLYAQLQHTPYQRAPDVAELGLQLMKARFPHLF